MHPFYLLAALSFFSQPDISVLDSSGNILEDTSPAIDSIAADSTVFPLIFKSTPETASGIGDNFKDDDECEDACKDGCEKKCFQKCGEDDECQDECEDTCEDDCEKKCAGFAPVYGPRRGAFLLSTSGNALLFHTSTISREEQRFLDETGFAMTFRFQDGSSETVGVDASYEAFSFGLEFTFFTAERIGFGFVYNYSFVQETYETPYKDFTETLMSFHNLALKLDAAFWHGRRASITASPSLGAIFGTVRRLPVVYDEYTGPEKDYLYAVNKAVRSEGISAGLRINYRYMITRMVTVSGGPAYDYSYIFLTDDEISGYPQASANHNFGFNINFGILLKGFNLPLNKYRL